MGSKNKFLSFSKQIYENDFCFEGIPKDFRNLKRSFEPNNEMQENYFIGPNILSKIVGWPDGLYKIPTNIGLVFGSKISEKRF